MKKLNNVVYAELTTATTNEMKNDYKSFIIGDTGVFLVTTRQNAKRYPELEFHETDQETLKEYGLNINF
jgi:asparagine synthetase A